MQIWPNPTGRALVALAAVCVLAGCSSTAPTGALTGGGGGGLSGPPDAVPRAEPKSRYGNMESYVVFGKRYYTKPTSRNYRERGVASWYGEPFHGRKTSSGEVYDMHQMTAAHKTLPLPTYARVTNLANGHSAVVKINDRGPFVGDRVIDLSYAAARRLDMVQQGTGPVEVISIDPRDHGGKTPPVRIAAAAPAATRAPTAATTPIPASTKATIRSAPAARSSPSPVLAAAPPTAPTSIMTPASGAEPTPAITPTPQRNPAPAIAAAPADAPARSASSAGDGLAGHARVQPAAYLQVGAFGDRSNAEALRQRLHGRLREPVQVSAPPASGALYKVRIGPLASSAQTDALRQELAALGLEAPILLHQ